MLRGAFRRGRRGRSRLLLIALSLGLMGVGSCGPARISFGIPTPAGLLPVRILLESGVDPTQVTVTLDGADVTAAFAAEPGVLAGALPLPAPGPHHLAVTRLLPMFGIPLTVGRSFESPAPVPAVLRVDPPLETGPLPRSAWLRFTLDGGADETQTRSWGFGVECDGARVPRRASVASDGTVVVNPRPELPAGASCRVAWRAADGSVDGVAFEVAADAAGAAAEAIYDRSAPENLAPFPDDFFLREDSASGERAIDIPPPDFADAFQNQTFRALANPIQGIDGWSRQPPIIVTFSHELAPEAVPADAFAAADPFAPISLIDIDPDSPERGRRIPYRMLVRSDAAPDGSTDHAALIFPTIDLRERNQYALVVTRRAFAAGEPGRPFGPSPFWARVAGPPLPGEAAAVTQARESILPTLAALEALPELPIPVEDVALAIGIRTRTHPSVDDLVEIKRLALAADPPELILPDIEDDPCPDPDAFCIAVDPDRALEVRGRLALPNFRSPGLNLFERDPATGLPVQTGTSEVPFVMTLPVEALEGPVIPIMYQHGNPGTPRELLAEFTNGHLDDAGFALMGIQDTLNREVGMDIDLQVQVIFFFAVQAAQLPDYWKQTGADMIHFLRAIEGMGDLDLMHEGPDGLPAIGPDGIPEIDPSTILYKGISEGGNNAERFLPFAPELLAAVPTVGGARLAETLIHQAADDILAQIGFFLPQIRPAELWVGMSLFQAGFDPQDGHTYLRHLYREPLTPFPGSSDTVPPHTLWTEGVGDSLVPNNASRAMALELGIPHVGPVQELVPGLEVVAPPLAGNLPGDITAGFVQFDPATTQSCIDRPQPEGHYCPQTAPEAQAQRLHFLESALTGAPEIVDPFL